MPLTDEAAALAHHLIAGAEKMFANAEALYNEATILANGRAWPRALFLHQIALEECAKVDTLGAAVTSLLMGHEVNIEALRRVFRRHEYKNKANAYFLPTTEAERLARDSGDFDAARQEFKQRQEAFHEESNSDKTHRSTLTLETPSHPRRNSSVRRYLLRSESATKSSCQLRSITSECCAAGPVT
jgi:AbiV family abortive infection protein